MLSLTEISIRIAGRLLIDHGTAQIVPGARVGFVGRNGVGKSTLFAAIRGELPIESGSIAIPPRWRIGSLAQEAPDGPEALVDVVLKADLERDSLLREAETAHDPTRIADIQTRLVDIDAQSAPARAAAILSGLGFSTDDQARSCSEFSGGWRMRVALAATLFSAPDLLLLDEPTNYLDLEGTLWLEDHLANYPRSVIVISHDRDLLDTSVDQILHLDRGKLTLYKGTYSSFEEQRAMREVLDAKHAKRQADERKRLQAFVDRFKAKASKARQAQSRVKMLERMKPVTALVTQDVREISFPVPERMLSPPIIAVDNVSVGYDPKSPVLNRVTLRIDTDDRIALLGSNGNGKSTLVKLLAGKLAPFSGHVTRADKLSVGYFAQHQVDELDLDASPYDHVRRLMADVVVGRSVEIELVDLMLREIADRELVGAGDMTGERRQLARQQFYESRLAVAVGAEQSDAVVGVDPQGDAVQHRAFRIVADRDIVDRDDRRRQHPLRHRKRDFAHVLRHQRGDRFHPLQHLDAGLRLAGFRSLGLEAVDEGLQALAFVGLALGVLGVEHFAHRALFFERGVGALVERQLAAIEMQDLVDRGIEQVAVMADDDHGAGVVRQMVFQPQRALEVEIVGRLVQQQEIGNGC